MSTPAQVKTEQMVFRKTNVGVGRHISVTPGNSTNRHLAYGRIILNGSYPSDNFDTGDRETGLICLSGTAAVHVDRESFQLGQYDSLYIPRDSHVDVQTSASADIAEFSADVSQRYPLKYVPYSTVSADPSLSFKAGVPGQQRHLNVAIGKNVEAGRLLLGFTIL